MVCKKKAFRISEKGAEVKQQISNPHDRLFKQLLGEPENAADFVANNLPYLIKSLPRRRRSF